jgi:hypothetical protein
MQAHRQSVRTWHLHMASIPGAQPYALDSAERLVKEDPMLHGGLVADLEGAMGPQATKAARAAAKWMAK